MRGQFENLNPEPTTLPKYLQTTVPSVVVQQCIIVMFSSMEHIENLRIMTNLMMLKFFKGVIEQKICLNFQLIYFQCSSGNSSSSFP